MTEINANKNQLRVVVDTARCQAYGVCVAINPQLFDLPDDTMVAHVLRDELSDEDQRDVEEAIYGCPAQAIALKRQER